MKLQITLLAILLSLSVIGQNVTINPTGITPLTSGSSFPRISNSQILALPSPLKGDLAYDLTFNCLRVYNGSKWLNILTGQDTNQPATTGWSISSEGFTGINKIEKDAAGNIFALGNFNQTATFGTTTKTSLGDSDIFLAKYDENGNLLWVKTAGSPAGDIGIGLKIDNIGNAIITGYNWDNITFESTILSYTGGSDICIAKYNTNGTLMWAKKAGGVGLDIPNAVETDPSGNIYLSGYFNGNITFFGSTNIPLTSAGLKDGFLTKYDSSGNLLWAKLISSTDENTVGDMEISGSDLLLLGYYSGTVNLGNSVSISSSTASNDTFIGRFDLNGNCQNVINLGSSVISVSKIIKDANSNFYICGSVNGSTSIGGVAFSLSSGTSSFFAKLNSSLAVTLVKTLPCQTISNASNMSIDNTGNIYLVGYYSGTISNYSNSLTSKGENDIYLAKFSSSGNPILFQSFGGSGYESGYDLLLGTNVLISGIFTGNTNLGGGLLNPGYWPNAFILRVSE
jgi:hypothetical protein